MLQRDYIMRLIREFMAALQLLLEGKDLEHRREELKKLYEQYIGPYELYHNATIDVAMRALASYDEGNGWSAWRCSPSSIMPRPTP